MATRATITVQNEDGKFYSIYSHWDGYISNLGEHLLKCYNTQEKAEELVSFGSMNTIGMNIKKCVFHHRDNKEELSPASVGGTVKRAIDGNEQEYNYFWENEEWFVFGNFNNNKITSLESEYEKDLLVA